MFKKVFKIFAIIVIMWIVSLVTIVREFRPGSMILSDKRLYDRALANFRHKYWTQGSNFNESGFEVWELVEPVNLSLSVDDRMSAVASYDIPPGLNGHPVLLNAQVRSALKQKIKKGWQDHAFNEFVSDIIPLDRSLPDFREKWCKEQNYSKNLPEATIVICFHNEAWSTLMRTVTSVQNRSPDHLVKEIILFDDFSTMDHLKKPLKDHVQTLPKVRLMRARRREGLIRARILAAKDVTSPIIVYLDSHCECTEGWLEPLLDRIASNSTTVVSPIVDRILDSTFEYIAQNTNDLRIGGFNWQMKFKWRGVPSSVLNERKNLSAPLKTPTISGGLFAISKEFFAKIGYYDEGFEIWGAENLELSFKVWMCGGTLEMIPCSHVGHVFRKRRPYNGESGSLKRNTVRLAEVWMDDYAKYYYDTIGRNRGKYGDVTSRIELRRQLNCKPFQWYLENVYPQLELPDNYVASGQIYSESNYGVCFDSKPLEMEVKLLPCHSQGGNQYWIYTKDGEIKRDEMCLDIVFSGVALFICGGSVSSQIWIYDAKTKHIRHMDTQKCLQVGNFKEGMKLILENCSTSSTQLWIMENFIVDRLTPTLQIYAKRH